MSKITPLPSIFLESGFNSGASMWFNLDSSSTWGTSTVPSSAKAFSQSGSIAGQSSSLFSKQMSDTGSKLSGLNDNNYLSLNRAGPNILDWQPQFPAMKKPSPGKANTKESLSDPLPKKPSPADEFVKISPTQRWSAQQPIGFQQSFPAEKKPALVEIPAKSPQALTLESPPAAVFEVPGEEETSAQNLYKTELCRSFEETGSCRYGMKCQFAHGRAELRPVNRHPKYKTEVCKTFHTIGTCPYGKRCRFIHIEPGTNLSQYPALKASPVVPQPVQKTFDYVAEPVNSNAAGGWSGNWFEPTTPVYVFSPVVENLGKTSPQKSPAKSEPAPLPLPVMKTSNELSQPRSRLVIFQQICS